MKVKKIIVIDAFTLEKKKELTIPKFGNIIITSK